MGHMFLLLAAYVLSLRLCNIWGIVVRDYVTFRLFCLGLCCIRDYVAFGLPSFILKSFGIMLLGFTPFGIMSHGILSVNRMCTYTV